MLHAHVSNNSLALTPRPASPVFCKDVTDDMPDEAVRSGLALDQLAGRGVYRDGADLYYNAQATDFAQPAVQAVLDTLGMRWMDDRLAQSRHEEAAHLRLLQYAEGPERREGQDSACYRAAALVSAAVGGGLSGAFNFGGFALVVGQVVAAMNHSPAGFGATSAGAFSGTAAGRTIVSNLMGSVPGSLLYAICGGLGVTVVRPLVDAVALLLSNGRVTPFVPVDPALAFPTPSPLEAGGWPKDGKAYTAELQANARQRADMAGRQAAMLDVGDLFNLKYGTPMFAICHAIRLMVLTALQSRGTSLAAGAGALVSGSASGIASAGLSAATGAERAWRAVGNGNDQGMPLFLPARTLRRIRGDAEPGLDVAVRRGFSGAAAAYVRDAGVLRKLLLGLPATALATWVATVPIHVLIPLATWTGHALRDRPAAAITAAGGITLAAFALAYSVLGRSLSWAGRVVRTDLAAQQQQRLTEAFSQSIRNFARRGFQSFAQPDEWSVAHLAALFDDMHLLVMADLDQAVAEGRNRDLDPGADLRLRDAYAAQATQMRQLLVAAEGAEGTPPGARSSAQMALLESLRQETARLQVWAIEIADEVSDDPDVVVTRF